MNRNEAHAIIDALAAAFGGHSQVPDRVVGAAVFGRANNAPTAWPVEAVAGLIDDCAAVIDERWEVIDERWEDSEGTRERLVEGYRAAACAHPASHAPRI